MNKIILYIYVMLVMTSCGFKGPLYLPKHTNESSTSSSTQNQAKMDNANTKN